MPAITTHGLPYPLPADPPDGAAAVKALALALDQVAMGEYLVLIGTATITGESFWVSFGAAFGANTPAVFAQNSNMTYQPQLVIGTAEAIPTGVRVVAYGATGTTVWQVTWVAIGTRG